MGTRLMSWALLVSCAFTGCGDSHMVIDDAGEPASDSGTPGIDAGAAVDSGSLPPPPPTQDVDLLFVIDNSRSMHEEQAAFAAEIPRLLDILLSGDFDQDGATDGPDDFTPVDELHVAIVTTDMGTGGQPVPSCRDSEFGDDGRFRTESSSEPGCMSTYPTFLSYRTGSGVSAEEFALDVACVSTAGIDGCGFEQQLEAGLKALSPGAPTEWTAADFSAPLFFRNTQGHGDTVHDGFLREESILGIIVLSDESDCSASDPGLFDVLNPTYSGTSLNLRCYEHEDSALHPISRYVDGFLQLRAHPSRVVFAPIAGVPVDLVPSAGERPDWEGILDDSRMQYRVDPSTGGNSVVPSCEVPGRGVAFPPRRMVRVARELDARGASTTVGSICNDTYGGVLTEIIRQLAR